MRNLILIVFYGIFPFFALSQNSAELDSKQGFKEIKLLNNISSVRTSEVNRGNGASRYKYSGDSKTVYNIDIEDIFIEVDGSNLIRKIKLYFPNLNDETFFGFARSLKNDFGTPCFNYTKESSTSGGFAWKTQRFYMEYFYEYTSWGKWKPVIVIGLLMDLPQEIRKTYENPKDGF